MRLTLDVSAAENSNQQLTEINDSGYLTQNVILSHLVVTLDMAKQGQIHSFYTKRIMSQRSGCADNIKPDIRTRI